MQLGARLSLVAVLLTAACGSPPPLDGLDGGTGEMSDDAGAPVEPELDAGVLDGGALDAEVADAQTPPPAPDAGPAPTPRDAGPAPDPGPTETIQTYKLLQWNIAGSSLNNCRTPAITNAVLTYVRNRGVHFISLNEICRAQYDAIRDALRREWGKSSTAVFSAWEFSGHRVGNAIFSRYDIRVVTREAIGTDRYGTRKLLCGRLRSQYHLRICSTHLSPDDPLARDQLRTVRAMVNTWWREGDTVILMGDLNLEPHDGVFDTVYAPGANSPNNPNNRGRYRELDDADPANCRGYGERTWYTTSGGRCGTGRKLDYIFVREERIVDGRYGLDSLAIPKTCAGGQRCSDHRALGAFVRVRIRPR